MVGAIGFAKRMGKSEREAMLTRSATWQEFEQFKHLMASASTIKAIPNLPLGRGTIYWTDQSICDPSWKCTWVVYSVEWP
ncbi:MAG: hypothetical protein AAF639_30570 [Chloroflexota bacterium]